ncbi:putative RNA-directed DNA polymerase from transposon X-element [Trichonephila clavipes]|nr:putative RNA-directed DNA polymerase from transposon X-element [Trichonephila clavipes]
MEVAKSGEIVSSHLAKLDVPLFKIPASEKELDRIILREKNKTIVSPKKQEEKNSQGACFAPPGLTFPAHVSTSLKIGFWNANSLRKKIHEVRDFVSEQNLDMFLVQETWLEPGIDPQIANYRLTKDDRIEFPHTATRGGTAIYCKNEIVHHRVPLPNLQGMDATAVQIKINNFLPLMLFRPTFEEEQAIVSQ